MPRYESPERALSKDDAGAADIESNALPSYLWASLKRDPYRYHVTKELKSVSR